MSSSIDNIVDERIPCGCGCGATTTLAETEAYIDTLGPGWPFGPNDKHVVVHFLWKKINNERIPKNYIPNVDIYTNHPNKVVENYPKTNADKDEWYAHLGYVGNNHPPVFQYETNEWYFFTPRYRKYANDSIINREAVNGYWEATCPEIVISDNNGTQVGSKRSFVYYEGSSQNRSITDWKMEEYVGVLDQTQLIKHDMEVDYVICKIYTPNERAISYFKEVEVEEDHEYDDEDIPF